MTQLSKEIRKLIFDKGLDVLKSKQLVYMLDDTYHFEKDKPKRAVIGNLIEEGYMATLIENKDSDLELTAKKIAKSLVDEYGYQENIVNGLLEDIVAAIGKNKPTLKPNQSQHGSDCESNRNRPTKPTQQSRQLPNNGKGGNNHNTSSQSSYSSRQSTNNNKSGSNPYTSHETTAKLGSKGFNILLWATFGLLSSSAIYITDWWVFGMMLAIAVIHTITILPAWGSLISGNQIHNVKAQGAYSGILLFCILNALVPTVWLIWEMNAPDNSMVFKVGIIGWLTSWVLIFFYFVMGAEMRKTYKSCGNKSTWRNSFWISSGVLGVIYGLFFLWPIICVGIINNDIDSQEKTNTELRAGRANQDMTLSFMGITLGKDTTEVFNYILDDPSFEKIEDSHGNPKTNEKVWKSYEDSSKYNIRAGWYNTIANIELSTIHNKVSKIIISHDIEIDTLVKLYTSKYGNPEIYNNQNLDGEYVSSYLSWSKDYLYRLDPTNCEYSFKRIDDFNEREEYYVWTFKDGFIAVSKNQIEYCSNEEISYHKDEKEKQERLEEAEEKKRIEEANAALKQRQADSIANAQKQKVREEEQRKKAAKQI